ncbi:MAG: Methyltransferase domain protein [Gammaproteobacteria bacterium]|jgi:SAM-dependent methyltransferase|nr:Methyltransferase domain protein [Gammaproteobacteria bacterium]
MTKNITDNLKQKISSYYSEKIELYGPTPQGVDWNSKHSQETRFRQLLKICELAPNFSINDLGCGFGSLYEFMRTNHFRFDYYGYDLSENMIAEAKKLYIAASHCQFFNNDHLQLHDFTVASGIFNVKMDIPLKEWESYILETLQKMHAASTKGFSFNLLTKYSDKEYMKDYLYYADPCQLFDYCKQHFSKNVALLHDYYLYEFTLLIRK